MKTLYFTFILLQLIVALYMLQPAILLLVYYIKKKVSPYKSPINKEPIIKKEFDFAAIITAHQDTKFIAPLVDSLLKQNYKKLHVYVVADACDISNLHFNSTEVKLLKPEKDLNAKIKSIQMATDNFIRQHDALVIFDSDNLVHPDYFLVLNKYFQQGYRAVQTQMLSKNTDSIYSKLDSIGHVYYNFLDRKMRMELALSSHILGLGIAVDVALYDEIMYKDRLGGFDKKMQADIVSRIPQLAYAEEALVYDEKVDDGKTLEKQRTRWLFTFFHYFSIHWKLFVTGILRKNFNVSYFGFVLLRPPLIILFFLSSLFSIINLVIEPVYFYVWIAILLLFCYSFIHIVITQSIQTNIHKAIIFIPVFMFRQIKALLRIGKAGKSFLKTEHTRVIYINDIVSI